MDMSTQMSYEFRGGVPPEMHLNTNIVEKMMLVTCLQGK